MSSRHVRAYKPSDLPIKPGRVGVPAVRAEADIENGRTVLKLAHQLSAWRVVVNVVEVHVPVPRGHEQAR